jgi:adenylate cyclase
VTKINPVLVWLETEGVRYSETATFLDAFATELQKAGIDLARSTTGIHVLHPQVDSLSCLWQQGKPIFERRYKLDAEGQEQFRNSPMPTVYGGAEFRRRLDAPAAPDEFPILIELRAEGYTDYLGLPLPFSDGSWKGVTYVTSRTGGFPEDQVELLRSVSPALARILEIQMLHRTSLTLLETYVGPVAGRRVLEGAIKRGMHENIHAVIWMCDMRGFTELSERLSAPALVTHINDYFGIMSDAVSEHGGEVLKFIGDAMLAIFPRTGADSETAPARALKAARKAEQAAASANGERERRGEPAIRYGIALHVGEVLYGNIGGAGRLDFTVIGRAVNVATRIEALCKTTGRQILMSEEFAEICGEPVELLGTFALKGVEAGQRVYAPTTG